MADAGSGEIGVGAPAGSAWVAPMLGGAQWRAAVRRRGTLVSAEPGTTGVGGGMDVGEQPARDAATEDTARRYAVEPERMYDIALTNVVAGLAAMPVADRPAEWAERLLVALWNASVEIPDNPAFQGPDYFTYVRFQLPAPGQAFQANCLARQAERLVATTCGAAFFATQDATEPVYVLSVGTIESMLLYDDHRGDPIDLAEMAGRDVAGTETIPAGGQVMIGSPSRDFLTAAQARGLYRHLVDGWKVAEPRVALLITPQAVPTRNLVIQTMRENLPADEELVRMRCRMLSWYLPPSRSIVLRPEMMALSDMTPLAEYCTSGG
ncbi:hypothetical protein ACFSGX_06610 [Sphingomonas arantia]|uniref:Uncharacterized protein n=1 Tax=Sphingomonas arantia TaxID=1460676 RepID=A0ABW4TWS7_9SPHN